jgi:hypothetical protein
MPCHAMHPIQDLFLEGFSYELLIDMHFICTPMWTKFYSCKKWLLHYAVWLEVECPDNDPNDVAFIRAIATIGGRDAVEEYAACKMSLLATCSGFKSMPLGMTPVSKVETTLLLFAMGTTAVGHADRVLAEVETEAKRVLGSFRPWEYDALVATNIPNSSHLNRVLEEMGVSYASRPVLDSEASQVANKNQKNAVS